jgi:hypothetical protein
MGLDEEARQLLLAALMQWLVRIVFGDSYFSDPTQKVGC